MRPQLTFGQLLTTTGRLSRSGFWTYQLAVMGSFLLLGLVLNFIKSENIQIIIVLPYILFVIFTAWIVQIKRWHDLNRSGWWCLTNFIPIFNLYAIIMCSFIKGTDGDNRFGSDPLAPLTPRHQPTTTVTPPRIFRCAPAFCNSFGSSNRANPTNLGILQGCVRPLQRTH